MSCGLHDSRRCTVRQALYPEFKTLHVYDASYLRTRSELKTLLFYTMTNYIIFYVYIYIVDYVLYIFTRGLIKRPILTNSRSWRGTNSWWRAEALIHGQLDLHELKALCKELGADIDQQRLVEAMSQLDKDTRSCVIGVSAARGVQPLSMRCPAPDVVCGDHINSRF